MYGYDLEEKIVLPHHVNPAYNLKGAGADVILNNRGRLSDGDMAKRIANMQKLQSDSDALKRTAATLKKTRYFQTNRSLDWSEQRQECGAWFRGCWVGCRCIFIGSKCTAQTWSTDGSRSLLWQQLRVDVYTWRAWLWSQWIDEWCYFGRTLRRK